MTNPWTASDKPVETMRHFVQYRNADRRGPLARGWEDFRVYTNKPISFVAGLAGETVWLIEGGGSPMSYRIVLVFIVDEFGPCDDPGFRLYLRGARGHLFEPPIPIPHDDWFRAFMRRHGNFAFGLQAMEPEDAARLSHLASSSPTGESPPPHLVPRFP